jgi:hypothetical protein
VGEDALYDAFDEYLRQRSQTTAKVAVTDGAALPAACRSTLLGCAVHCIALHCIYCTSTPFFSYCCCRYRI